MYLCGGKEERSIPMEHPRTRRFNRKYRQILVWSKKKYSFTISSLLSFNTKIANMIHDSMARVAYFFEVTLALIFKLMAFKPLKEDLWKDALVMGWPSEITYLKEVWKTYKLFCNKPLTMSSFENSNKLRIYLKFSLVGKG